MEVRRRRKKLDGSWEFLSGNKDAEIIQLPHTWNAEDGQDGGNDYYRGKCRYTKQFKKPEFDPEKEKVFLEFCGVSASAEVKVNGILAGQHEGGYSTFRMEITELLKEDNILSVDVDNSVNNRVYPQKADFTFYGGIYRDVSLIITSDVHFDLMYYGGDGLKVTAVRQEENAEVHVETFVNMEDPDIQIFIKDADGNVVVKGSGREVFLKIPKVHLWDGLEDPYLYTAEAVLYRDGEAVDAVEHCFGVREFYVDPEKGFFLNGRSYPLRGVARHQDWKGIGTALERKHHDRDMDLIREIGANTIRLSHYQHDQYFYDLCDRYGMIVWAEIPYISEHLEDGEANTIRQMKELIVQNYHHPSIVVWGLSNEITISTKNKKAMLENHRKLNDLAHEMDPGRLTTLACYAMCTPFHPVAHISDIVSWNLYLGWYVPGFRLNDLWMDFFHWKYPKRCLGYAEYGAEGMPNLHSSHPKRGDHTEEYQAIYHEYMLECFKRHPFLWATHVWNMFDFAADARDQGGEPGMNHKGLVTFDRQIKKDSFYLYKANWNTKDPFVHICGSRYVERPEVQTEIKIYSNQKKVSLYQDGMLLETKEGEHIFRFDVWLRDTETRFEAVSGDVRDEAVFKKVDQPNPAYRLEKKRKKSKNWV